LKKSETTGWLQKVPVINFSCSNPTAGSIKIFIC
jgi:hypothetical protein